MVDKLDISDVPYGNEWWDHTSLDFESEVQPDQTLDYSLVHMRSVFEWACAEGFKSAGLFKTTDYAVSEPFFAGSNNPTIWRMCASLDKRNHTLNVTLVLAEAHAPVVVQQIYSCYIIGTEPRNMLGNFDGQPKAIMVGASLPLMKVTDKTGVLVPTFIRCVLTLSKNNICRYLPETADLLGLAEGLEKLRQDRSSCDSCLIAKGGAIYRVHKLILKQRAAPIYRMFRNKNVICLDIDPNAMREFVTYLYSGRLYYYRKDNIETLRNFARIHEMTTLVRSCDSYLQRATIIDRVPTESLDRLMSG